MQHGKRGDGVECNTGTGRKLPGTARPHHRQSPCPSLTLPGLHTVCRKSRGATPEDDRRRRVIVQDLIYISSPLREYLTSTPISLVVRTRSRG